MKKLYFSTAGFMLLLSMIVYPCTFFMSTSNGITFFGNNEDSPMSQTNIWFIPSYPGKYGYVYFGYNNGWPQGGMNDQGLCFDGAATPKVDIRFSPGKKAYRGYLPDKIMEECSTVEDVLPIIESYKFSALRVQGQVMYADRHGEAVIIGGPDNNGDLDIVRKTGTFLVCTNFFPNHPELGNFPSSRYDTAFQKLKDNPEPSVEHFRSILEKVSVGHTQYSKIFDLNNQIIHIYFFHNFSEVRRLDLNEELKKGPHAYRIASLFPESGWEENLDDLNGQRVEKKISKRIPEFILYQK